MNTKQAVCSCEEVDEQELLQRVEELIGKYHGENDIIQALHMAQGVFGYLPLEVQTLIAEKLEVPLSQVSGVVSFYSFFSTQPRGKHTIRVCLGTACYVRGGKDIVAELEKELAVAVGETTPDRQFTLEVARCIGACGLAPVMSVDDTVYRHVNVDELDDILNRYRQEDEQDG